MLNYLGFYQGLSSYYMVFMNCIAALTLSRTIVLLQFLSDCGVKTSENFSYEKFSPSLTLSDTITKKPKNFAVQKPLRVLKLLRVLVKGFFLEPLVIVLSSVFSVI